MTLGESLDTLLNELDNRGPEPIAGQASIDEWTCRRRLPRHSFRTACVVTFVQPGVSDPSRLPGRTRNLSRNGLGLLVRRPFSLGDAIEVELMIPDRPPTFVAGLATFCRYAGRGFYELGIALKSAATKPIFNANTMSAEPAGSRTACVNRK